MIRMTLNRWLFLASIVLAGLAQFVIHGVTGDILNAIGCGLLPVIGLRIIIVLRRDFRAFTPTPQDAPETLPIP